MSAYTPKMGGTKEKTIDYAANATLATNVPAILRLTTAEREAPMASSMKIQIQTVGAPNAAAEGLHAAVNAQRAAYLKLIQPVHASAAPAKNETVSTKDVHVEHELMSQIPRLKETLAALDSEMHANACSDVDKRMLVHERILQLQAAQLSMVQKSVTSLIEQQARQDADNNILSKTSMLHAKLHKAAGTQVLATAADVLELQKAKIANSINTDVLGLKQKTASMQQTVDLHSELHKAGGAGVLRLQEKVKDLAQTRDLHSELHHASGAGVLRLHEKVMDLAETRDLHSELHKAGGAGVLHLHEKVRDLAETRNLHSELHHASGSGVLDLQKQVHTMSEVSKLHSKLHKATGDYMTQNFNTGQSVGASASQDTELRKLRTELDALARDNSKLKASVAVHDELHRTTSSIVQTLGKKSLTVNAIAACGTCTTCNGTVGKGGTCHCNDKTYSRNAMPVTAETPSTSHARILSMLQTDITSSNKPRQNRRF